MCIKNLPAGCYLRPWQGATAIYGGPDGVHASGVPVSPGGNGPYEQLQPKQLPIIDHQQIGETSERCCTSVS